MDNKISAALILSLGLVISAMIISHNGGIRFVVEIPTLKVDVPALKVDVPKISVSSESDIGRYRYIPTKDGVGGCFDTTIGREYSYFCYGGTNGSNRMLEFDYINGKKYLLNDFNETSR